MQAIGPAQASADERTHNPPGRGRVLRRVALFQVKLMADGLRDVVLSPLSIAAAALGLLSRRPDTEIYLDRLMRFGRETDQWINLFDHRSDAEKTPSHSLDSIAQQIEEALRRDFQTGGLSAKSAKALAEAAARLRDKARR
ncbi:hypothetical protein AB2N04_15065 [Nitratireductor sp. GISD-1A_MAKvit]|uniref:hypothetical protein n=1 Tax=Nitratireductor sp. GISD-1A_MAKvit TaxID=3234198 RepID=UPI003467A97E